MAVSDSQYKALLARVSKLEETLSNVLTALNQFVTVNQVHQLTHINNSRIEELEDRMDAVEAQLELEANDPT